MSEFVTYIDLYCERTAAGFFNEPLNAISNASFVLAAWWNAAHARKSVASLNALLLCALAALIGLGSFAFHTIPNPVTQWLDVGAIWGFVVTFVVLLIHLASGHRCLRTLLFSGLGVIAVVVLFVVTGDSVTANPRDANTDAFNGSLQYLPAFLALMVFSVLATIAGHPAKRYLWMATGLFTVALMFRTIDLSICRSLPVGTHFLWHALMGLTVAVLLRGFIVADQYKLTST